MYIRQCKEAKIAYFINKSLIDIFIFAKQVLSLTLRSYINISDIIQMLDIITTLFGHSMS